MKTIKGLTIKVKGLTLSMPKEENNNNLGSARPFIDAIIGMRVFIKQYYHHRIRNSKMKELTYEMFQVMAVLWNKGELNQQDIANAIQKNKASITPLIDNLCKRDLVMRSPSPDDRRNNVITLTEKGKRYEDLFIPIQHDFHQLLLSQVEEEELKKITQILNKITTQNWIV